MKNILVFLFLLMSHTLMAQGYIIMSDGSKVEFETKKAKWSGTYLIAADGKEYLATDTLSLGYFLKNPVPGALSADPGYFNYTIRKWDDKKSRWSGFTARPSMTGKIGLYYIVVQGNGTSYTTTYMVKGDSVHTIDIGFKKATSEKLKSLVSDNQEVVKMLEPEQLKGKAMLAYARQVIRAYNVAACNEPQKLATDSVELIVYRRDTGKDMLPVTVGTTSVSLAPKDALRVRVPSRTWTKMCVTVNDKEFCDVAEVPPHYTMYYEITKNANATEYEFQLTPSTKAKADLEAIERKKSKD